jgi:predicted porin
MKKTLIALAVLAASGASFAQVSITGNYTAGYEAIGNGASGDSSGLGIDTSLVTFTASEDLGGGMKATAVMSIDGMSRGGIAGGDSSLALAGSFGTVTLATGRGSDYLSGGVSGVGGVGLDNKVFTETNASDSIAYKSPSFSGLTFGLSHAEDAGNRTGETQSGYLGLGSGATGSNNLASGSTTSFIQRSTGVTVTYAAGPLVATGNYTSWDQQGVATSTATGANNSKSRVSVAGSYDLGVAKLGAGYRATQFTAGTRQDSFLAVGVPLGALTLGADFGQRTQADRLTAADNGTRTGYGLKAEYALSKRTSFIASYASWERTVGADKRTTDTNLLVSHSF